MSSRQPLPSRDQRGAVLIVALLLAAIIGISLVSYFKLANNSLKQASRSFYSNSAMNVAEIGLERAIACFNQLDNGTVAAAWPTSHGWSTNNTTYNATTSPSTPWAKNTITLSDVGPGVTGNVKVYVHNHPGTVGLSPKIVAKATINQPDAAPINKYIEVTLRKRSLFANGLVAKDDVEWDGTPKAASYNSDPTGTGTPIYALNSDTALAGTGNGTITANITVGSLRGDIDLAGGTVWGYAKTGPDGSIDGGTVRSLTSSADDATRRTNDFNATFPNVTTPTPTTYNSITSDWSSTKNLGTGSGDASYTTTLNNITGTYYFYVFNASSEIQLSGSDAINISGNVVLILNTHTGSTCISTTGSAAFNIGSGATLNVYTNGNVNIAGGGVVNGAVGSASQAKQCFFWGTRTTDGQTFNIRGNGELKAVVYAPNAVLDLRGGGSTGKMIGSVVGKQINMNGGTEFYYDESLSNITTGNPWGISKWKELQSASDRSPYATLLEF